MTLIPTIILTLFLLYLTRRKMTVELSKLINRCGGGKRTFIWLWSLIFLPGTIIHEVSHFLAAALTGTRTGNIEIFPSFEKLRIKETDSNDKFHIHLGSVQTQRLNPIRGFIVGIAPLLTGMGLLIWLSTNFRVDIFIASLDPSSAGWRIGMTERLSPFLILYLFFTIANSLFPSWADVKQTLPLIIIGIILGGILWLIGVQIKVGPESPIWEIMKSLSNALWISVGINTGIDAVLWIINKLKLRI